MSIPVKYAVSSRVFNNVGSDGSRDRVVARTRGQVLGSEYPSAMRTRCRRWRGARSLMAVGSSLAGARDERDHAETGGTGRRPEDPHGRRLKERLFWWVPLGGTFEPALRLQRPGNYTVRCPRSLWPRSVSRRRLLLVGAFWY